MEISENLIKQNFLKTCLQFTYPTNFYIICSHFYTEKKQKYLIFKKNNKLNKNICASVVMTNGFALKQDKNLQIYRYFFYMYVQHQAKKDFLKDVESRVVTHPTSASRKLMDSLECCFAGTCFESSKPSSVSCCIPWLWPSWSSPYLHVQ